MRIRPTQSDDLPFIREELTRHWGECGIWSLGVRYQGDELPGFVAIDEFSENHRVGLVTYIVHLGGYQGEVITLSSRVENQGVGAALLDAAAQAIRGAGCARAFLTTTNDNLRAIGFYQKRGWRLAALHKGRVEEARRHAPHIPGIGMNNIPLRDEIELELVFE
jgi:ribosomal protein S18 acetylase RimI-like enzyme